MENRPPMKNSLQQLNLIKNIEISHCYSYGNWQSVIRSFSKFKDRECPLAHTLAIAGY